MAFLRVVLVLLDQVPGGSSTWVACLRRPGILGPVVSVTAARGEVARPQASALRLPPVSDKQTESGGDEHIKVTDSSERKDLVLD